ncbi:MAG: 50S ribosomal protein L24 [Patescibacteria group bacterium]|nr:50S ribosomal protein L24 [Patescibacteria group bacterium]MCL5093972.1 50S ribosomal protein L24 [Patescibacteria group bacterium]
MNIKKNDKVLIRKGKDRGKTGIISKVSAKSGKIIVEGINMAKKHAKSTAKTKKGGILTFEAPIYAANTMVICPSCNKATRISIKKVKGGKERICKKCASSLDHIKKEK